MRPLRAATRGHPVGLDRSSAPARRWLLAVIIGLTLGAPAREARAQQAPNLSDECWPVLLAYGVSRNIDWNDPAEVMGFAWWLRIAVWNMSVVFDETVREMEAGNRADPEIQALAIRFFRCAAELERMASTIQVWFTYLGVTVVIKPSRLIDVLTPHPDSRRRETPDDWPRGLTPEEWRRLTSQDIDELKAINEVLRRRLGGRAPAH